MVLKSRVVIAFGVILMVASVVAAAAQEISCRSVKKGVEHVAKITLLDSKVESFFYGSMGKNGHTCEVIGSRQKTGSSWVDEPGNRTLVSLSFGGEEIAKVSLQNTDSEFMMKILTPTTDVCGVGGYIAKTVVITANKSTCSLRD